MSCELLSIHVPDLHCLWHQPCLHLLGHKHKVCCHLKPKNCGEYTPRCCCWLWCPMTHPLPIWAGH